MSSETDTGQDGISYSFGPFCDLLAKHFPSYRGKRNVFDVQGLARDLGYAHETLYRAVRQTKPVSTGVALTLIQFSRSNQAASPLVWADLAPYVLPEFDQYSRAPGEADAEIDDLLG